MKETAEPADPEKARRLAEQFHGQAARAHSINSEFGLKLHYDDPLIERMRPLLIKAGTHFIEQYRSSPRTTVKTYQDVRTWLSWYSKETHVHDCIHMAVARREYGSLLPRFLMPIPDGETYRQRLDRYQSEEEEEYLVNAYHPRWKPFRGKRRTVEDFIETVENDIPEL